MARLGAVLGLVLFAGTASAQMFAQGFPCPGADPVACVRDVNAKDASGYTLLATVLFNPRSEIAVQGREPSLYPKLGLVRRLLDAGANVNGDHGGWGRSGALGLARREEPETIALLVARGATLTGTKGRGPLSTAIEMERDDLALALIRRDRKVPPADRMALALAARRGWGPVVTALLEAGADANIADSQGMTALMLAERRRDTAMAKSLVAAGARPSAQPARPAPARSGDFTAVAAKEIDDVVFLDPPRFSLVTGRENHFIFYAKGPNQFEEIRCERNAAFEFIASANLTGGINVGICSREAKRVRELAAAAQPGLKAVIGQLSQAAARLDTAALEKLGWTYTRNTGANGAEEHSFAVIAIGHGLLSVPTVVLVPRGMRHAVIVQAEAMKLCENYGLSSQTPLCGNTRQALADIARRLAARFAD